MKKLNKIVFGLVAILAMALAGLSAFFFIAGRDIEPPDVRDVLPPPVPPITEAENMVQILMSATNRLVMASNGDRVLVNFYRKDGWNHRLSLPKTNLVLTVEEAATWADRVLATNAALFAAFDEAVKRPRAQYPADVASVLNSFWRGSQDPLFWQIWHFEMDSYLYGALVALRARRQRECGQAETAVLDLLKYGEMFARFSYRMEHDTFVVHLRSPVLPVVDELAQTAFACDLPSEMILATDAALTRWAKAYQMSLRLMHRQCVLRAQNVLPTWRSLKKNPAIPNSFFEWQNSSKVPKWIVTLGNRVGKVIQSFPGYQRYLFQPNRTIRELADIVRETESYVYAVPYTAETRARRQSFNASHPMDIVWTRRNGCGTASINSYSSWEATRQIGTSAFMVEAIRVSIAAARYKRKNGHYPATLNELVPEFLTEVPRDPFDASKPLGYNAEQGTLHTVGTDGSFNGKIRDPRLRYGGVGLAQSRWMRRIDGRPIEIPLKSEKTSGGN